MTTKGIWGPVWRRLLRAVAPGVALVVLAGLGVPAVQCRAAEALLPEARTDIHPDARERPAAPAPARASALAAAQASRPAGARAPQAMVPARGTEPSLSLMPYLEYLLDESATLDIEEAAAPGRAADYAPLVLEKLPRAEGVMWLRFTLAPLGSGERPATFLLDMGESIPGTPMLYEPERNDLSGALEWRESSPAQRNVLLLPEAGAEPLTCYIRLDGLPGLWFSPMVRTPADAATNWGSLARTAAILALGVVMLLCLLRGLSENGQWRIWTALYVAVALGQALLGMPDAGGNRPGPGQAAATLAPGIALMLLPHVGRHLMRTRERSRSLDIQFLLLSLPGAVLALLPLVPGWAWLDRWLDLWPAATLFFVPTTLGAWIMGIGGARRFLLGCLLPPLFVAGGVLGLDLGIPPNLLASAPLWGTALSALLIAATGAPADMGSAAAPGAPDPVPDAHEPDEGGIITLEHPLDDPNLRLIPGTHPGAAPETPASAGAEGPDAPAGGGMAADRARAEAREGALRAPLDDLLREGAALEQCALPPAVRQYAAAMLAAARRMADVLSHADTGGDSGKDGGDAASGEGTNAATVFDLQRLLREAHGAVAPAAEYAGIGLAWYMPPHLGQLYRGDARALGETLGLLLESAVRATRQGAVHLSARRVPESSDPGNILFTVTDTGTGAPPRDRSSLALARAWELAARHGGYVGMEYGPNGATIAFSLHLEPLEDSAEESPADVRPHVIIVAEDPRQRRELARMLADLPCRCSEAGSEHEALRRHEADPAVLLVAQGRYALPAAADMVMRFLERAAAAGISGCKVLAVTVDDSQWNLLADSGFTHALLEPVDAEALRQTVRDVVRGVRRAEPEPRETEPRETARTFGEAPAAAAAVREPAAGEPERPVPADELQPEGTTLSVPPVVEAPAETGEAEPEETEAPVEAEETVCAAAATDAPSAVPAALSDAPVAGEGAAAVAAASAPETREAPLPGDAAASLADGGPGGEERGFQPDGPEEASAASGPAEKPTEDPEEHPEEGPEGRTEEAAAGTAVDTGAGPREVPAPEAPDAGLRDIGGESAVAASVADDGADAGLDEAGASFMAYAVAATPVMEDAACEASSAAGEPPAPGPMAEAPVPDREDPADREHAEEGETAFARAMTPGTVPRRSAAGDARKTPAARAASVYVSPALSSPGEWVGEPMPIGSPISRRPEPGTSRDGAQSPESAAPAGRPAASSARTGYTSPSVPVPGEWVGEPVPIRRAEPVLPDAAPEAETGAGAEEAAPGSAPAVAPEMAGSFMDFIVGATRAEAPAAPRQAGGAPSGNSSERREASSGQAPAGGVTDFVETSVSLVASAVSSAFSTPSADAASAGTTPAASGAAGAVPPENAPVPGAPLPDAAILELVERLDAAMAQANEAHAAGRGRMVAQAAARIAEESESFGFRVLGRMARCVERAGRAGDMNALRDLLPELAVSVERNRIALTQRK